MTNLEHSIKLELDFNKLKSIALGESVLPVVVQHADTKDVLILAYVNERALRESVERKLCVFWSTSRQTLWVKGDTSGDYLDLKDIRVNCEQNSLLFLVIPRKQGVCHAKDTSGQTYETCFYRQVSTHNPEQLTFLY